MARPSLGVLAPPFCRPPGIGGRSSGAGEDIAGLRLESKEVEDFKMLATVAPLSLRGGIKSPRRDHMMAYLLSCSRRIQTATRSSIIFRLTVAGTFYGKVVELHRLLPALLQQTVFQACEASMVLRASQWMSRW